MNRLAATVTPERPILFSVLISSGYVIAYLIQSWPQPLRFWSHSWLDDGDGLVMVWNAWLARQQGLNFVWTDYLFAPDGIPLLVHTYVPLKGWIGALLPVPVIPAVNLLVLGSFALAGTWTFWVARRFSPSTWSCLLAGYKGRLERERVGIFPCRRECRDYTFRLTNEHMPVPLLLKGNTQLFENHELKDEAALLAAGIDRLVYQPELPM